MTEVKTDTVSKIIQTHAVPLNTERISHYFFARLPQQFDAIIHIDETTAVEPLERTSEWEAGEAPETYPTGI